VLIARHRRSIALDKAAKAQVAVGEGSKSATFDRLKECVHHTEATASAELDLLNDDVAEKAESPRPRHRSRAPAERPESPKGHAGIARGLLSN